ncbi:MAG: hypothetical protein ACTSVU_06130 [Promethearchaeota archaeon]
MSLHNIQPGGPICPICKINPARVIICPHCGATTIYPCQYCQPQSQLSYCPKCHQSLQSRQFKRRFMEIDKNNGMFDQNLNKKRKLL